ncbi:hypothetical protein FACS1894192_08070 [Bacilli bacterium]|nr:hypothetical protein FACS1894192_08070 [Bacilli bacterium]
MDENIVESKMMIITESESEKKALMAYDKLQGINRYSVYVSLDSTPSTPDMDNFDRIYVEVDNYQKLFDHIPTIEVAVPKTSQITEDIFRADAENHGKTDFKDVQILDKIWSGEFRRPPKESWDKSLSAFRKSKEQISIASKFSNGLEKKAR